MSTALIIVDVQNDFIDGPVKVADADKIITVINKMIPEFKHIIVTKDWHPYEHCSFKENGGQWPKHCIANSYGAKIHSKLNVPTGAYFVQKGADKDIEQYSAFSDDADNLTGLDKLLKNHLKVDTVYICGLTTDYCVLETALDANRLDFSTRVVLNACKEVSEETCRKAHEKMVKLGIKTVKVDFSNTKMSFEPAKIEKDGC